jgi:hypothetical protein
MKTLALTLPGGNAPIPTPSGFQFTDVASVVNALTKYIFVAAGLVLLIVILSSGFTLLTSAGDAKAMEKGKKGLTNGITGFIIIFVAYWLVQLAGIIFGMKEITDVFQ